MFNIVPSYCHWPYHVHLDITHPRGLSYLAQHLSWSLLDTQIGQMEGCAISQVANSGTDRSSLFLGWRQQQPQEWHPGAAYCVTILFVRLPGSTFPTVR